MMFRQPPRPGFSLIELMCAMAAGTMVLLAAAHLLGGAGDGYRRSSGGVAAEREARAAIDQLAADLSCARHCENAVWEKSPSAWPADRIGFLSLQAAAAQSDAGRIGDLCAVHWYVDDLVIGGKTVRCLMRGVRQSAETFKALGEGQPAALFARQPATDEPVAFGVVSFEARPKTLDSGGRWIDWVPSTAATGPRALDVRLVIARRPLAAKLRSPSDWNGGFLLGPPGEAEVNKDLEIYSALIRYGNHENP